MTGRVLIVDDSLTVRMDLAEAFEAGGLDAVPCGTAGEARQALDRTRGLLAEKAAAPADLERAEAQMRSTQAALELLQVRLDRTTVRAPFGGVAGARLVSVGDYVTTATRLITLQTVNPQRASFQVPERYSDRLKEGQRVLFQVAALPGRDFRGTVDAVVFGVRVTLAPSRHRSPLLPPCPRSRKRALESSGAHLVVHGDPLTFCPFSVHSD